MIPVFIITVMFKKTMVFLLKYICCLSLPAIILAIILFISIHIRLKTLWFYYIDIAVFEIVFLLVFVSLLVMIAKHGQHMTFKDAFCFFVLPVTIAALAIGFIGVYFSKKYELQANGSWQKYVLRLVVYPILVDGFVSFTEVNIRQLTMCEADVRSHVIFLCQVAFGIIGRYMTTTAGSLSYIAIMSFVIAVKDIGLHRMSRIQCWIAFKLKRFFRKCIKCGNAQQSQEEFDDWFFSKDFTDFRAFVVSSEFVHEFTGQFQV